MKILRIVSSGFEEGGVENGIVLMQPIFNREGHEVRIMASDYRSDLPHFENYTFKSVNQKNLSRYFYYAFNPYSYFLLKKILKEYKPDIVQLHTMGQVSSSVLFLLKEVPTVLTIHGPEAFTESLLRWYLPKTDFLDQSYDLNKLTMAGKLRFYYLKYITGPLYRLGIRKNVDVVVTLSHYMQKLVESDGIKNQYVPNGAVLLDRKPLPDNKTFAYVGRLEKFKGVDYLLKAMQSVIKKWPDTLLIIAGEGSYRQELEQLAHDLCITKNIVFKGHVSRLDIKDIYQNSMALIMPSIWPEAFGKVGIEAMSVGRPVIATNVGGVSDWLINEENGYLIDPKDSISITNAMLTLLDDNEKLNKMSSNARKMAEKFSLEHHVELMISLYQKVINENIKN